MAELNYPLEGRCRCGETRFEVSGPPLATSACHCEGCRRMSSSAYSLTAIFPAAAFVVIAGEPVQGGAPGEDIEHQFCPRCMSWMFTRIPSMEIVNVRPTMLDDPALTEPFMETQTAEKLDWVELSVQHSFERFPDMGQIQQVIADYAARG